MTGIFKFKPHNISNSFVYINRKDFDSLRVPKDSEVLSVELRFGANCSEVLFASLGPFLPNFQIGHLSFSSLLARNLGVNEGDEILLSFCQALPISVAYIRPKRSDDYNIMMNIHSVLENSILDQIRVVAPGQIISLKVGNIGVDLITDSIKPPGKCGRLEKFTEFVVLDQITNAASNNAPKLPIPEQSNSSLLRTIWNFFTWSGSYDNKISSNVNEFATNEHYLRIMKSALEKKAPLDYRVIPDDTITGSEVVLKWCGLNTNLSTYCRIAALPENTDLQGSVKVEQKAIFSPVRTIPYQGSGSEREICVSRGLMEKMALSLGSRVLVEETPEQQKEPTENEEVSSEEDTKVKNVAKTNTDAYLWKSMKDIKVKLLTVISSSLNNCHESNALIVAPPGCGKSFLMKNLAENCTKEKIYCCSISCKEMRGKRIESLLKRFTSKWSECAYREPSVLFIDDIDVLMIEDENEADPEGGMASIYSSRVAAMLEELSESFQAKHRVSVIATAASLKSLLTAMASTRGPRQFDLVAEIPEMTADDRKDVLTHLGLDVNEDVIAKTQGYRMQDLLDLAAKAQLEALVMETDSVSLKEVETALEVTTPMALLGVRLHKDVPYTWDDVGGMQGVKAVLDEIFRWPSQFPQIFETCPLRLQSGALLFGPPGCGKTLVAGALANECGMNFISVKGPEVLSKYVGASEAAVRDLFERAARAQPCLLFFDELDSLAPRRGHDTTGVTDRVVNQLLTQLDGVEARTGVWVLGASSRPDLIDPALLRPGRLDRSVLCTLPSVDERREILEVLSKNLQLASDVNLAELATKTENYSGADLQALLYNSHIKAVQQIDVTDYEMTVWISLRNVEEAFAETKPSLSPSEKLKYDRLFRRFINAKNSTEPPMPQRVTLM